MDLRRTVRRRTYPRARSRPRTRACAPKRISVEPSAACAAARSSSSHSLQCCRIAAVEELNHALHAALQFKNGQRRIDSEEFARDLELQAQVDTYLVLLLFVAFFRKTQRVFFSSRRRHTRCSRDWSSDVCSSD